jgi:hypothetical protein
LENIDYNDTYVYIWIYDPNKTDLLTHNDTVKDCMKKYDKAIFVTNYNQNNYLSKDEQNYLKDFPNNKSIHEDHYAICESHLKAFLIPKNCNYIFKLDGDDMYYPNFKVDYFNKIVEYMRENELKIITRPFWAFAGDTWSFGFTVAESNILKYIQPEQVKGIDWYNIDIRKIRNLDNLFGYILMCIKKIPKNKLYFKLSDYDWPVHLQPHFWTIYLAGKFDYIFQNENTYIHKINGIVI